MIRSLTIGLPLGSRSPAFIATEAKVLINKAQDVLKQRMMVPRTVRFTLPAVGLSGETEGSILASLFWVDNLAFENGVRWFCLPLDFVADLPRRERLIAALDGIGRFPRLFLNMIIADQGRIAVNATNDAAGLVLNVARKTDNGFDNFRVGTSCNCPANAPFFPFSRHEGDDIAFSFALETTSIALDITNRYCNDIALARDKLIESLVPSLQKVDAIGKKLASDCNVEYRGLDASFAPFPDGDISIAKVITQMLGSQTGSSGSVFITAMLTDSLRAAIAKSGAKTVGFNGVMFSMLEDRYLAKDNNGRGMTLDTLVALAAVCGCGIDMVPIPGASFQEGIAALMLDIAGMSSTLRKPLGVRLLPIPGRRVNEFTRFNLDILCDSRIMSLESNNELLTTADHLIEFRAPFRTSG